jgi:hypothetical protein
MSVWTWLGEQKNQQILMFIGGGMGAGVAVVVPLLFQFGVFEPKAAPVVKPVVATPQAVTPRAVSAPAATATGGDPSVQVLLDVLVRKEKADKAEREYKQEGDAWEFAQKLNTIKGYQVYLSDYPKGHYAHFAMAAIDKLRSPVLVAQPDMNSPSADETKTPVAETTTSVPVPHVHKRKVAKAAKVIPPVTHAAGQPSLLVQCAEGTKLYVDGKERGRITSNLFGSFVVTVPAGSHTVVLVSPQGVLQQQIELKTGDSLRLNPPFCSSPSSAIDSVVTHS